MPLPASVVVEVVKTPTFWGVAVVLGILGFAYFRDVRNPEKAAQVSVLGGLTATTTEVFQMAQTAMTQSREAQEAAHRSAQANIKCEQTVSVLVAYIRILTGQLVDAGVAPRPMPSDLMNLD
jgi:hypothetical protein